MPAPRLGDHDVPSFSSTPSLAATWRRSVQETHPLTPPVGRAGAYRGRKRAFTDDQVDQLRQRAGAGETKTALARTFGVSRETVYQYLRTAP